MSIQFLNFISAAAAPGATIVALGSATPYGVSSTDGITWSNFPSAPGFTSPNKIAAGAGVLVTTTSNGLWSSSNGTTWTQRVTGSFEAICFGLGKFVAKRTGSGQVYDSTDGISWNQITTTAPTTLVRMSCDESQFLGAGYSGSTPLDTDLWTSPTGASWTVQHTQASWSCGAIVSNASGESCAFGYGLSPYVLTSTDGVTWTSRTATATTAVDGCYGSGKFVAVGGASSTGPIIYSSNLTSWSSASLPTGQWTGVCFDGSQFVACSLATNMIATSPDAATWTARTANDLNLRCIAALPT